MRLVKWTRGLTCAAMMVTLAMGAGSARAQEPPPAEPAKAPAPRFALAFEEPIPLPSPDGATQDRLTLTEAAELAVAYHPALVEAEGRLRAARGNWLQVGLKPNPEIGYAGNEIGNEGEAGQQGGFVSQEFVTAGKLGLSREVAMRDVAAAEQRFEQARLQVVTTAQIYYFEVLAAQRAMALAKQLSNIAEQAVQVSELRLKALDIPRSSLLQSQIERESAALLQQQAIQRYDAAWRRLAAAIGIDEQRPKLLDDVLLRPLPELEWETTRERILANSPELAELRFAVERARWAVDRASAGRVPNVNVQAGVAHDHASDDTIANVQVSLPLPVFNRNQGGIAAAWGELTAAQAALQQRQLALEQRLAIALRDYATSRQRVERYAESILPAARESLELINAGYQQGELDYVQVLSVQQTYAQANLAYLQDLETAWKKWAQIESFLVGPLPDARID